MGQTIRENEEAKMNCPKDCNKRVTCKDCGDILCRRYSTHTCRVFNHYTVMGNSQCTVCRVNFIKKKDEKSGSFF